MRALALLGVLLGLAFFALDARAETDLESRVAIYRALVRNEPYTPHRSPRAAPRHLCRAHSPRGLSATIRRAVHDAWLRFAVPKALIHSVIRHESAYDPNAVSVAGAVGLMQLMPATARELGVACPRQPRENVLGGTRYLRQLRDRFGSWSDALAAYHAGPTAVARRRIGPQTVLYVRRVLGSWRHP